MIFLGHRHPRKRTNGIGPGRGTRDHRPGAKLMIDAVHRCEGYVVQSTDDGIFALFGAPVAHEDHPQRALYAALRLQEEKLERYSARLREAGNLRIEGRVGVNKGGGGGAFDHDRRRTVSLVQS
jgi:hypothetical protein